jgi:hypothetical protein
VGACGGQSTTPIGPIDASAETASANPEGSAAGTTPTSDGSSDVQASEAGAGDGSEDSEALWTPNAILSELAFWFDPTSLRQSNGLVVQWVDLTGNLNDASQPTAAYQPTYTASGIGGLPSATFDGPIVFLQVADSPPLQWGTSDLLILAVVRGRSQSGTNAMIYQKVGVSPFDGAALYLNADNPSQTTLAAAQLSGDVFAVSAPPPSTFDDGSVHLLGTRRTGVTLEIRVDGVVSNSIDNETVGTVNVSAPGYGAMIGQNGYRPSNGFQQFYGDIAEMIGVGQSLTQTDIDKLEQYLMARYGIQ